MTHWDKLVLIFYETKWFRLQYGKWKERFWHWYTLVSLSKSMLQFWIISDMPIDAIIMVFWFTFLVSHNFLLLVSCVCGWYWNWNNLYICVNKTVYLYLYVVYRVYFPSTNTTVQGCCDNIFFLSLMLSYNKVHCFVWLFLKIFCFWFFVTYTAIHIFDYWMSMFFFSDIGFWSLNGFRSPTL